MEAFTFHDIEQDCKIDYACHTLDGRQLGVKIHVPKGLYHHAPYNSSAYCFLQQLRDAIFEFGTIEFPELPVNPINHTLAQRAPWEHTYSTNPYMTDFCQSPHQDTPPYPTAFWLNQQRHFFATWLMSLEGVKTFQDFMRQHPHKCIEDIHKELVPASLHKGIGILVNQEAGLILIDNSQHQHLYHARTCLFENLPEKGSLKLDTPMYAFNEIGLLNYIDTLDSHRGDHEKNPEELALIRAFMEDEKRL